jgi:hypothetical protein
MKCKKKKELKTFDQRKRKDSSRHMRRMASGASKTKRNKQKTKLLLLLSLKTLNFSISQAKP